MKWPPFTLLVMVAHGLGVSQVPLQAAQDPKPIDRSPSQQGIQWTQSKTSQEFLAQYDYVGGANSDVGTAGPQARVSEHYAQVRQIVTRRCLRALLAHGGMEWQHFGFNPPSGALLPDQLDAVDAFFGADFRWSRKGMFIVHVHPGFYSDLKDVTSDFNAPLDLAYSRVVSKRFQWVLGLSVNTLRDVSLLPGGGFRYQLTDRWKLKCILPEPQVEYKARDDLHVYAGGHFRGDTFRVSKHFGDDHGNPSLNNALVDYREIRVGAGFSWNIKPMMELNMESGYLVDRQFNYHNNGIVLRGGGAPYASLNVHVLFELWAPREEKEYDERIELERQLQVPIEQQELKQLFK